MTTFLIQVSGYRSEHDETKAEYWWEEPIKEGIYINYNWQRSREMKEAWEKVKKGDKVLIYCTDNTPFPKQISHIAEVEDVEIDEEKAVMSLKVRELPRGILLDVIREKIESGELSEKMRRCGTQGFNICVVEDLDYEVIVKLAEKLAETKGVTEADIRAKKEIELQEYFEAKPEVIESGLKLITDCSQVLPENAGIPDLIGIDKDGNYVVIELKAGEAGYDALGQVISYKSAVKKKTGQKVRAILIAHEFDPKIKFATEVYDSDNLRLVEFKKYKLKFELENVT